MLPRPEAFQVSSTCHRSDYQEIRKVSQPGRDGDEIGLLVGANCEDIFAQMEMSTGETGLRNAVYGYSAWSVVG